MTEDPIKFPAKVQDRLEDFEFQYGPLKGKLALAMDLVSDAEITAGQLGLYCRDGLRPERVHPDVEQLQLFLRAVRQLVKDAFRTNEKGDQDSR